MKNGWIVLLLTIFFIGISCEKEITPAIENQGMPLITREIYSDDTYNVFTYNEQNLLKEKKSKWSYNIYKYDANNRLISMDLYEDPGIYSSIWEIADAAIHRTEWVSPENTQKSAISSYNYQNQIPESISVLRIPSGTHDMSAFQCDDKGRIVNQVFYSEDTPIGRIAYSYDVWGNVSREEQYANGKLVSTHLYEYDKKHNPFKVFRHLLTPGINTNENNIIKETQKLAGSDDPNYITVQVIESAYEYNSLDYPVLKDGYIRYEYK
jgi:hypothetical protein